MKDKEAKRRFREEFRSAVKIIDFVKKKELPVRAYVMREKVPSWGYKKERE
jgi:hypothetical protein|tara:strand:- start:17 stop:169 length:153 start_codon:yes stop_codon:yes gene_type:complete